MASSSGRKNPAGEPPKRVTPCNNCGGRNLYSTEVSSGGGHAPNYLPSLAPWWSSAKFDVVVCKDCGLTRFFADEEATGKLARAKKWTRVKAIEDY